MANEELIMHAREFTESPNLGKDMARELDTALIYIRELADIAEAAEARVKELEAGEISALREAVARVRALETFSITDSYPAWTAVDHDDLLAALDGAPEPEVKP